MPQTASTFDAVLKDWFGPKIVEVINNNVRMLKLLQKGDRPAQGKNVTFPVHKGRNLSVRYQTAGDTLLAAGQESSARVTIPFKQVFGNIRITEDVMKQSKTNRGAFEYAAAFEIENMTKNMMVQANRASFGDGTGKLAESAGALAGSTLTLRGVGSADVAGASGINANASNRYLRVGDTIDILANDFVTFKRQGATITAADFVNGTIDITGGGAGAPAAGDGIYLSSPTLATGPNLRLVDPTGIGGIIDAGQFVATLFGIDRTAAGNAFWQAQKLDLGSFAAPGTINRRAAQRMEDMLYDAGWAQDYFVMSHASVRNEYADSLIGDRRFVEPYKYDAGFKESKDDASMQTTLTFNGHPWLIDRDAPWRTAFFINPGTVRNYVLAEPHWIEDDKGAVMRVVTGIAATFEAQLAWYYNHGVEAMGPNTCGVIRQISSTPDRVPTL